VFVNVDVVLLPVWVKTTQKLMVEMEGRKEQIKNGKWNVEGDILLKSSSFKWRVCW
jgi:hypothetical protein